jgi:cytoskeletal protein RodZ
MTYDPNNPNNPGNLSDPVRRIDPDAKRLDPENKLHYTEPTKKTGSMTPWLVLIALLVVAGIIWMQVGTTPSDMSTTNAPAPTSTNETTTQTTPPPATPAPSATPAPTTTPAPAPMLAPDATPAPTPVDPAPPAGGTTTQP